MKKWTKELLEEVGYEIENAKITSVDLSMEDHGCLTLKMTLDGGGWGCVYGGYVLGHGYVGAKEFKGSAKGIEYLLRIMDVVEVGCFSQMKGKIVRVAVKGWGDSIKIIGNVIKDKWFDPESFFKDFEPQGDKGKEE